ncbi:MAG: carnitine dehydratase [Deltaproteobacteria bacterium]|nr:carnitine dehydratase [Deltaproteobacteria bacterium]
MKSLLADVRVIEVSMFAPNAVGMHLADLGAEVIKLETPGLGDPARMLGLPIGDESPATRRWNRGKHSVALDLRSPEGAEIFRALVAKADAVIEGMRAGSLDRRGLGYATLLEVNPRLVYASVSGWGEQGPYRDLGAHGLAFDAYAGLAPARAGSAHPTHPTRPMGHVWQGIEAAPLFGAMAVVSGILRARSTGAPSRIEVSQADAAAVWNGWRIAYEAASKEDPLCGSEAREQQNERIAALAASAEFEGPVEPMQSPANDVRYQYYRGTDGMVLLMATETRFWENFCRAVGRPDLFERWPGEAHADHDYGNDALRDELVEIFATRSRAEWIELFIEHDVAGAPVYEPGETWQDPHFQARALFTDPQVHGMRIPGSPLRMEGRMAVADRAAPKHGADTDEVLRRLLDMDDGRLSELRKKRVLGVSE